jgi:polyphosphate kinase
VLKNILDIQLKDNVKARILDNELSNRYVRNKSQRKVRAQVEIYNYLYQKSTEPLEASQPVPLEVQLEEAFQQPLLTHETGSD